MRVVCSTTVSYVHSRLPALFLSRVLCAAPTPQIVGLVASDPGENALGLSNGDAISVVFDRPTNRPLIVATADILAVFNFTSSLGATLTGEWQTVAATGGDVAFITIKDITRGSPTIGSTRCTVIGNIKDAAQTSRVSRSQSGALTGNWGLVGCGPYGAWFNGTCWYIWLTAFMVIAGAVLGCVIFWVCLWRRVRAQMLYMEELATAEAEMTGALAAEEAQASKDKLAESRDEVSLSFDGIGSPALGASQRGLMGGKSAASRYTAGFEAEDGAGPTNVIMTPAKIRLAGFGDIPGLVAPGKDVSSDEEEFPHAKDSKSILVPPELGGRRRSSLLGFLKKAVGLYVAQSLSLLANVFMSLAGLFRLFNVQQQ